MFNKGFSLSILLITFFISSCAGVPARPTDPSRTLRTEQIFAAPKDKVWQATIVALTDMGAPILNMNEKSGVINTQEVAVTPNRVNSLIKSGIDTFMMTWRESNYQINVIINHISESQTKVIVVSRIRVKKKVGTGDLWLVKQSNGTLENTLFTKIQQNL